MTSDLDSEREEAIDEIVEGVVDCFFSEFRKALSHVKVPQTEKDYHDYVWRFIEKNLSQHYQRGDPFVEELVKNAAAHAKDLTQEYDLKAEVTPKVVIMALYDFVILCDDSGSMKRGGRIQSLQDTCQCVADIAGLLQPQGISLRFLNYPDDQHFDQLASQDDIKSKMSGVTYKGFTRLGTVLGSKITEPLILNKAKLNQFKRPVITIIITDGCPSGEPNDYFQQAILNCKKGLSQLPFEPASAIFIISRVGNDPDAEIFLSDLRMSKDLEGMLYCCKQQLDLQQEVFRRAGNGNQYSSFLIKLFSEALEGQADTDW
ncbi:hypothetical protein BDV28DRAFT_127849 [Aspergillus coremiiformis]|uniref:VWFA domain-containing protein n=1 Tax=Aspergillus coremiiformis TaxID=138285 RepID=A0A5N6ZIS0_9EURO|nr:hypothetical protein BDV28DRAFT_127849 [Aspergillus coremiiformis]